jgi:hypothetical protein
MHRDWSHNLPYSAAISGSRLPDSLKPGERWRSEACGCGRQFGRSVAHLKIQYKSCWAPRAPAKISVHLSFRPSGRPSPRCGIWQWGHLATRLHLGVTGRLRTDPGNPIWGEASLRMSLRMSLRIQIRSPEPVGGALLHEPPDRIDPRPWPVSVVRSCGAQPVAVCTEIYATTGSFVTSEGAGLPSRTASMLSRASMPIAKRVSTVALPMCGNRNVFLSATYPG